MTGAALLALAGCGSGSGGGSTTTGATVAPTREVASTPTAAATATAPVATATTPAPTQTATSPESEPGGAGDETPISTQALFTGDGGDITPATVNVPPFIAVNVILHSKDGGSYGIEVARHALNVDGTRRTASVQLEGLRAGKRYTVDVTGAPETLAIVAKAEPGP